MCTGYSRKIIILKIWVKTSEFMQSQKKNSGLQPCSIPANYGVTIVLRSNHCTTKISLHKKSSSVFCPTHPLAKFCFTSFPHMIPAEDIQDPNCTTAHCSATQNGRTASESVPLELSCKTTFHLFFTLSKMRVLCENCFRRHLCVCCMKGHTPHCGSFAFSCTRLYPTIVRISELTIGLKGHG